MSIYTLLVFWRKNMNQNMENFEQINTDIKKLLENIESVKSNVDIFSVLVDNKVTLVGV